MIEERNSLIRNSNNEFPYIEKQRKDCGLLNRPHFNYASLLRKTNLKKAVKKSVGRWSNQEKARF